MAFKSFLGEMKNTFLKDWELEVSNQATFKSRMMLSQETSIPGIIGGGLVWRSPLTC
jgi:hypothetical protein